MWKGTFHLVIIAKTYKLKAMLVAVAKDIHVLKIGARYVHARLVKRQAEQFL